MAEVGTPAFFLAGPAWPQPLAWPPARSEAKWPELTVLIDEHADGDAAEVEAVQEVLDVLVGDGVIAIGVLVLQHALGHGGHYVIVPVPDGDQGVREPSEKADICQSPAWGHPASPLFPMIYQFLHFLLPSSTDTRCSPT